MAIAALSLSSAALAQNTPLAQPQIRIVDKISNANRTPLTGSYPESLSRATVGARLGPNKTAQHLVLVLKPTDSQVAALKILMDEQQDRKSQNFHKWLTPEEYGRNYGVAASDIAQVTAWLQDSGLSVELVSKSGQFIQFSGGIRAVESAFGTEVHNLTVDGVAHISNISDISVPSAIAPVVKGLARLNNFFPISNAVPAGTATIPAPGKQVMGRVNSSSSFGSISGPNYGTATGTHYVAPGDVAAIYNAKPLLNANIDGTGQSISVIARSNINLSDVASFRTLFGLGGKLPKVTVVGTDPGLNEDDTEAYLDAEWAGAVAPNVDVNFIVSGSSLFTDGIDNASLYAVDNNIGDIISLSYGGCEKNNGATVTAFYNSMWQQAAAQGQTVMVSSGDSGAAGCDSSSASYATSGYGVNALGSSNYNVAVGGSIFVDFGSAQYWGGTGGSTIPFANALSYIPEAPLNQSRSTTTYLNSASTAYTAGTGIFAGGGGVSAYSPRPSWQTGSGIGADPDSSQIASVSGSTVTGLHRLVPDIVSISASGHDGSLYCASGLCSVSAADGLVNAGIVGGTSVATPVWASAQALINQKNGGRQGNANYYYYKLAAAQYNQSATACQATLGTAAAPTVTLPAANCTFQDVVTGSIRVPTASSGTANIGFDAAVGYDEASGLGSANITNMANNWSTVNVNATTTTFSLLPLRNFAHGTDKTATVRVSPASGSGTPTGDVSLIATATGSLGAPQVLTLSGGSATKTINTLPGGTYSVYAHYAGDGTFEPSDSLPVTVVVSKEDSAIQPDSALVSAAGNVSETTSFTYGAGQITFGATITGVSGHGNASGTVTYTLTRNGLSYGTYTSQLDPQGVSYLVFGPSFTNFNLAATGATLPAGSYSLVISYAGDASFNASTSTIAFTVSRATAGVTYTAPASITSGQSVTLSYKIATPTSATAATGTVQFVDNATTTLLGTAAMSNGSAVLTTSNITGTGTHSIAALYSGDPNYASSSSTQSVAITGNTAPTVTVTTTGTLTVSTSAGIGLVATLNPTTATGSVTFVDGTQVVGTATVSAGVARLTGVQLSVGSHTVTASYQGSTANAAARGSLTFTIAQSTTAITLSAPPLTVSWGQAYLSANITRSGNAANAGTYPMAGQVNFTLTNTATNAVSTVSVAPTYDPAGYYRYVGSVRIPESVTPGTYTVSASYSGDTNYGASSSSVTRNMTITKAMPALTVADTSVIKGSSTVAITALLSYPVSIAPTGSPTITVGGTTLNATCTGTGSPRTCTAMFSTASLTGGQTTITANYAGDANYTASATATASLFVSPDLTGVVLTLSRTSIVQGSSVTLNVKVKDRDNASIVPTGSVTFFDGTTAINTVMLSSGLGSMNYTPQTAGSHTLSATFTSSNPATFTSGTSTTTPVLTVAGAN